MTEITRRTAFKALGVGAVIAPQAAIALGTHNSGGETHDSPSCALKAPSPDWAIGVEGQRRADLGNGTYRNPIVAGDHPDPTVLKDGDTYYMTFSSFYDYPGLVIWKSHDLVNWAPVGPTLKTFLGTIWAVDLCKHQGRYFIYIPAAPDGGDWGVYVIWADRIEGPWSEPVHTGIKGCIDPGHVVGEDGHRYLFVNGIRKVRLSADGLSAAGALEPAYDPWHYPEDWIVEGFSPEGPKLLRRDGWFYIVTAVGGTSGPATGHMVIVARSRSVHGPWENCPHNPIVRSTSAAEPWWSRGHATIVEGPAGDWWLIYHGYENGFRTLGRQTLLEPMEWTADGWPRALGGDLSRPLPKPAGGKALPSSTPLSDDFTKPRLGVQWAFFQPGPDETARLSYSAKGLAIKARGTSPVDSSPFTCGMRDRNFQIEVTIARDPGAEGGLLLFYNHKAFVGVGLARNSTRLWQFAEEHIWARTPVTEGKVRIRLASVDQIVTIWLSDDAEDEKHKTWRQYGLRMDVSGLHHNTFGGFLSLKAGIYSTGTGAITASNFRYKALPQT